MKKKDLTFKKTFIRENSLIRGFDNFIERGSKNFSRGAKILAVRHFFEGRWLSAGGGGPK